MNTKYIILLLLLIGLDTGGRTAIKESSEKNNYYYLALGILIYGGLLITLYYIFKLGDFAITAAFWDAGTVITSVLLGYFLFKERYKTGEWIGMGTICFGFILLAIFAENKNESKK